MVFESNINSKNKYIITNRFVNKYDSITFDNIIKYFNNKYYHLVLMCIYEGLCGFIQKVIQIKSMVNLELKALIQRKILSFIKILFLLQWMMVFIMIIIFTKIMIKYYQIVHQ